MNDWAEIRRLSVAEGLSQRAIAVQIIERSVALAHINSEIWNLKDAMTQVTAASVEYATTWHSPIN
jgi:hypothetical protein